LNPVFSNDPDQSQGPRGVVPDAFNTIFFKSSRKKLYMWMWHNLSSNEKISAKKIAKAAQLSARTVFECLNDFSRLNMVKRNRVGKFNEYELVDPSLWKSPK